MSTFIKYNEQELLIKVQNGNKEAFQELYDRFAPALYGICFKVIHDEEQAQDILQDAFVKIWKKIKTFDASKGRLFTWMLNVTRNTAIDAYRKKQRVDTQKIQTIDYDVNISKGHQTETKIDSIGMNEVILKLPKEQQIMIEYLYFKGYTQKETAEELDMPIGTVKSRIRIAVKTLREVLKE